MGEILVADDFELFFLPSQTSYYDMYARNKGKWLADEHMTDQLQSLKPLCRWHLYILLCRDRTYYTGITNNLSRRLKMHNSGKASRYTRSRLPVRLVYHEQCRGRSSALRKEYAIKQLSRMEKKEYIRIKSKMP